MADQATKAGHASELGHDAKAASNGTDHPSATPRQTTPFPSKSADPSQSLQIPHTPAVPRHTPFISNTPPPRREAAHQYLRSRPNRPHRQGGAADSRNTAVARNTRRDNPSNRSPLSKPTAQHPIRSHTPQQTSAQAPQCNANSQPSSVEPHSSQHNAPHPNMPTVQPRTTAQGQGRQQLPTATKTQRARTRARGSAAVPSQEPEPGCGIPGQSRGAVPKPAQAAQSPRTQGRHPRPPQQSEVPSPSVPCHLSVPSPLCQTLLSVFVFPGRVRVKAANGTSRAVVLRGAENHRLVFLSGTRLGYPRPL